jgi:hypothetical protein
LEQGCYCLRHACLRGLCQRYAAAPTVSQVGCPLDQAISLHPSEHLRHWRLLNLGEAGEVALRACVSVLQCDQNRQLSDSEAEPFKA